MQHSTHLGAILTIAAASLFPLQLTAQSDRLGHDSDPSTCLLALSDLDALLGYAITGNVAAGLEKVVVDWGKTGYRNKNKFKVRAYVKICYVGGEVVNEVEFLPGELKVVWYETPASISIEIVSAERI